MIKRSLVFRILLVAFSLGLTAQLHGARGPDPLATGATTAFGATASFLAPNDPPVVTTSGGTTTFVESAGGPSTPVAVDASLTVTDSANATLASARVAITGNFHPAEDVLAFANDGSTMGNVSASFDSATGVLTLTSAGATATVANWQSALRSVTYTNGSDTPGTPPRSITFVVNDGVDDSSPATRTVSVTAVNDAPVISVPATIVVTEDVTTAITGISASDADAGSASVTMTLSVPSGSLSSTGSGGVTVGGTASALTLTGSLANINAFVAAGNVGYRTRLDATANVTLTISVNDGGNTGAGGARTESATTTLVVTAINDAPTITAPASINVTEDVTTAITGISAGDADAGSASVTMTLSVPSGSLSSTGSGGVTVGGTASALTLTGSLANINTFVAIGKVGYTTSHNATANVTLTISVNDGGNTGAGGARTDSATTTLVVTAINDAPTITAPVSINVTEDVATALTGISFADVDAGAGTVTVTLSAASGTLAASSGGGIVVAGSGTGTLTLAGTLPDVNAFVAAGNVTFTTSANATTDVTLAVAIDDGGNTGADPGHSGTASSESAATTVTLAVAAVNDAPVNSVPPAQTIEANEDLTFGTVTGNAVSISDVDAGGNTIEVNLTASNGLLTLSGTTGLAFATGTGAGDASMRFFGTLTDINNALNGMVFSPTPGYSGGASLQIATDDLARTGSGGPKTDIDTIAITVQPPRPVVSTVTSLSANGTYRTGQTVVLAVTFDQAVIVDTTGGTPTLLLETGSVDRVAPYQSGSGSNTLTFLYTIQPGDASADLDYVTPAALTDNGATIRSAAAAPARLALPAVGGPQSIAGQHAVVIDGVVPRVASVSAPAHGTYAIGQTLDFAIAFDESVVVTGVPALTVALDGGGPLIATYLAGSGSSTLTFRGTVSAGQFDGDGIAVGGLLANGGTITDVAGNAAILTLANVASTTSVLVDGVPPAISFGPPSAPTTISGPVTFDVTYAGASIVTLDAAHVTLLATGSAAGTVSVTGSGPTTRTVTVSAITGTGSLAIAIASGTAVDAAGNAAGAAGPSAAFSTIARELTSVTPTRGRAAGGVAVTLVGTGFATLGSPVVLFGTTPAVQVNAIDDRHLRVVTPSLPAGVPVGVTVRDGSIVVATLAAAYTPVDAPEDDTTDTDQDGLPDTWELWFGLDPHDPADAALDPDNDGASSLAEFQRGTHPVGTWTRALAEGVASPTFATGLSLFNPGVQKASVVLHYLRDGNGPIAETIGIEPGGSVRRWATDVPGLSPAAFATEIESNVPLVATGLTSWDAGAYGSAAASAVEPSTTWYLAEGATHGPFDLFYLLGNTNDVAVDVDVTFLRPSPAEPIVHRYTVAARSRLTLWVDTLDPALASTDVAAVMRTVGSLPIVVERAMYAHDGSGRFGVAGHRAAAVSQPSTTWHLAEGYVGEPFDTYLLIANAEATPAEVTLDVMGDAGVVHSESHVVPAGVRFTRHLADMPVSGPVGLTIRSTNAVPVVVERAMWWRDVEPGWIESHASAGATVGATRWGLSGLVAGGPARSATYLLIQNVDATATTVSIAVYAPDGTATTRSYTVAGESRLTVDVGADFPSSMGRTSSAIVSAATALVVEASSYSDAEGVHWSAGTNVLGTPMP